jgi:glycosyltransferase involved in cell wall biosynthesis
MNKPIKRLLRKMTSSLDKVGRRPPVKTIAVCAAQVPFFGGGAEQLVLGLVENLRSRGYDVDVINIPYKWYPHDQLLKSIEVWKMLDLTESNGKPIDMLITTKFPSYFARHPNKVLWLMHQYRQAYDLFGTEFSEFDAKDPKSMEFRERLIAMDTQELKSYSRIYTIARNPADRLRRFNGLQGIPLYHPPRLVGSYITDGAYGDFILSVGRLDKLKRVDRLLQALPHCPPAVRCIIAGTGPEEPSLRSLARKLGLENRVDFQGFVSDEQLLRLYAECAAVYFAPLDEDYGYITLEAFLSNKPVITVQDSGGPLEFVEDGRNGLVLPSLDPELLGAAVRNLVQDKERCRLLGSAGYSRVKDIQWDQAIRVLLGEEQA